MIRSVGAGTSGLNAQTRRKAHPEKTMPFPPIDKSRVLREQDEIRTATSEPTPMMVGGKVKAELTSIFDEENGVLKLNADGDRLEVSKRAISLAKEKLFN